MPITLDYSIVCDEVRREDNGKLIIIGMYVGVVALPQLPFVLPSLTFCHFLRSDRPGHWPLHFWLERLEDGVRLVEGRAGIVFQQPGPGPLPIRLPNVPFQAVGQYHFVTQIEEGKDPILTAFAVALNTPPQIMGNPPQLPPFMR